MKPFECINMDYAYLEISVSQSGSTDRAGGVGVSVRKPGNRAVLERNRTQAC